MVSNFQFTNLNSVDFYIFSAVKSSATQNFLQKSTLMFSQHGTNIPPLGIQQCLRRWHDISALPKAPVPSGSCWPILKEMFQHCTDRPPLNPGWTVTHTPGEHSSSMADHQVKCVVTAMHWALWIGTDRTAKVQWVYTG